jgi:hypothetical protein
MRRFDKTNNMVKANLLAEQRYLESRGLIKEDNVIPLKDILQPSRVAPTALYVSTLKLIDGPFLTKNPDWKDKPLKFLHYNGGEGLVGIKLAAEDISGLAYPNELVIDLATTNKNLGTKWTIKKYK